MRCQSQRLGRGSSDSGRHFTYSSGRAKVDDGCGEPKPFGEPARGIRRPEVATARLADLGCPTSDGDLGLLGLHELEFVTGQ